MKRKLLIVLLAIISVVACAFGITACNTTPNDAGDDSGNQNYQQHSFTKQVAESKYLKSEATCTEKAVYYYSCECGERGTETFEYGDYAHTFIQQVVENKYLKSEATCTEKAVYYYSCECGEKGTATFEYGEYKSHDYENGQCKNCLAIQPFSDGLEYISFFDNNGQMVYSVKSKGTCIDTQIRIPESYNGKAVKGISNSAFVNCSELTSITIPDGVTSIGDYAFSGCTGLTGIIIPGNVTSINNSVFFGCTGFTSIIIPGNVTSIGSYAFSGCNGLTSVTIPDSVTSIDYQAFYGCSELVKIDFTGNAACGWCAIDGIEWLMRYGAANKVIYINNYELTTLIIPDGVASIGVDAFYNCSGLTSITIPDSVTFIGLGAFDGCTGLTSITVTKNNSVCASQDGILYNKARTNIVHIPYALKGDVIIPDGVTSIVSDAFKDRSGLTSITIPDSVTSIGSAAFSGCNSLEGMMLPFVNSLFGYIFGTNSYIGGTETRQMSNSSYYITYYVPTSLRSVVVTGGNISYGAFSFCSRLTSITIGNDVSYIDKNAFYMCDSLESVIIGNGVTSISDWAFYGCDSLESITLPFVGYRADATTANYTTVFGYIFGYFSNKTFSGQYNINNYHYYEGGKYYWCYIPSSLHTVIVTNTDIILDSAFYHCSGLTSITIPDSVTSIGDKAFCGCSGLTSLIIPDSVTSIGSNAFGGCGGLVSITVAENNVDYASVDNCLLTKDGTILLAGCKNSFIPNSVTSIGVSSFFNCSGLEAVYYGGTADQWNEISINSGNEYLINATRYYFIENEADVPEDDGNYWHYVYDEIVVWMKED